MYYVFKKTHNIFYIINNKTGEIKMKERKSCLRTTKCQNYQKAQSHNSRVYRPEYALPKELSMPNISRRWVDKNGEKIDARKIYDEFTKSTKLIRTSDGRIVKKSGKKVKFANTIHEVIINLKQDSSADDVVKVANLINQKWGYQPLEFSIHRDEGYIVHKETKNRLSPSQDYWVDEDGTAYFMGLNREKTKEKKLDTSQYEACINYHAHLLFSSISPDLKQRYGNISSSDFNVQDEVAKILGMPRGEIGSKAKHLSHRQYKEQMILENATKNAKLEAEAIINQAQEKALKIENKVTENAFILLKNSVKIIRQAMAGKGYSREDFFELEAAQKNPATVVFYSAGEENLPENPIMVFLEKKNLKIPGINIDEVGDEENHPKQEPKYDDFDFGL